MANVISIRLSGADAALFEQAKARFGLSRMANVASLLFLLEKALAEHKAPPPPKQTRQEITEARAPIWELLLPVLNSPLDSYWTERKENLFSHVSAKELFESETERNREKRLEKAERFYQDYLAWQEGDDTYNEVPFAPAKNPKILCNAS